MNTRSALLLAILLACGVQSARSDVIRDVKETNDGLTLRTDDGNLRLQVFSDRVVRIEFTSKESTAQTKSLAVIAETEKVKWNHKHTSDAETLSTSQFTARIDAKTGALSFLDTAGKTYLAEVSKNPRTISSSGPIKLRQAFKLSDNEAIYGLGQHQTGMLNYRGATVHLQQANTDVAVPMLISSYGYGLLWDNASVTDVAVSAPTFMDKMSISSEAGDAIDYYFIAGPNLDDVIASYRKLTGAAPMMARWTWGLWQSKEPLSLAGRAARCRIALPQAPDPDRRHRPGLAILAGRSVGIARV